MQFFEEPGLLKYCVSLLKPSPNNNAINLPSNYPFHDVSSRRTTFPLPFFLNSSKYQLLLSYG